ncbi:MAG: metal-dependent transcriptional regulator [Candidatus Thorarchaeota archaeon]
MQENAECHEDYLKAIYLISKKNRGGWVSNKEISDFLKIKPASVSNMLYKLKNLDFIYWKPRSPIRLSSKGKEIVQELLRNYNCLQNFFKQVLNLKDPQLIQVLCCKIEHLITPEVSNALDELTTMGTI